MFPRGNKVCALTGNVQRQRLGASLVGVMDAGHPSVGCPDTCLGHPHVSGCSLDACRVTLGVGCCRGQCRAEKVGAVSSLGLQGAFDGAAGEGSLTSQRDVSQSVFMGGRVGWLCGWGDVCPARSRNGPR